MLIPKTKKLYIEARYELGREWQMFEASSMTSNPTWAPTTTVEEASEYVLYDSTKRGSEECIITSLFFEDLFPDVGGSVWGNEVFDHLGPMPNMYWNERTVYASGTSTAYHRVYGFPVAIYLNSADVSSAGDGEGETCLGILMIVDGKIGDLPGFPDPVNDMGNPRMKFLGLGGNSMPIYLGKGDKLIMRMNFWGTTGMGNNNAGNAGHTNLGLWPAYGNVPVELEDQSGFYNVEQWNYRFFMNSIMEVMETTIEEKTADELGFQ